MRAPRGSTKLTGNAAKTLSQILNKQKVRVLSTLSNGQNAENQNIEVSSETPQIMSGFGTVSHP